MPLVKEFEHPLPALQVSCIGGKLEPVARPRQRHVEDLADSRGWPIGHHHDPVGEKNGLVHVMGNHHDRVAELLVQGHDRILQMRPCEGIERTERLVEQENLRLHRKRAGNADALFHAAGDFRRPLVLGMRHLNETKVVHRPLMPFGAGFCARKHLVDCQPDIVVDREPGQQAVVLENDGAIRPGLVDLTAFEDDAALRGRNKPGDNVQQRRLSAAGMPDDRDVFTLCNIKRDVLEDVRFDLAAFEGFRDVIDFAVWRHCALLNWPPCRA